jgi:hypothetical protein
VKRRWRCGISYIRNWHVRAKFATFQRLKLRKGLKKKDKDAQCLASGGVPDQSRSIQEGP